MRILRWLLLVAMLVLAAGVYRSYVQQRQAQKKNRRATPSSLPSGTVGTAIDFEWAQSADGKPAVKIFAKNSKQTDNNRTELQDVELRIYMKDAKHFDRIRTPLAEFATGDNKLYAPGEAEITLGVPSEGEPDRTLTSITAAGINFDSQSGQAITDKHVQFSFNGGSGTCNGASYDPESHSLHLSNSVVLNLRGKNPKSKPMKVEAGDLTYSEVENVVRLGPWSRLTRDQTIINAGASVVNLAVFEGEDGKKERHLGSVDAAAATGTDKRPGRELEYAAGMLHVAYNADGLTDKLTGTGGAKLVAHGNGAVTTMNGDSVDLFFNTESGESELSSAIAKGHSQIESKPTVDPKGLTADTKSLKSDVLNLHMRAGGHDLERVDTPLPGTLEFLPNQIARHRRVLRSSDMDIRYGAKNEIQSFKANNAATQTYPSEDDRRKKKPNLAVANTSSKVLDAVFDDKQQLKQMHQTGDFHYSEGPRKAEAESATLENDGNIMRLNAHARVADDAGSTAADAIELHQATGDFDARGHVSTTRLPDEKKATSDMLDKGEPTQGMADRVTSENRNRAIHYVGNAVVWQASNRIQADRIDIDREKKTLLADGQVTSQFLDNRNKNSADKEKTKPAASTPIFTIVRAPHMVYTDQDRQAVYSGGTEFVRSGMTVKSATLRSFLNNDKSDSDSRIDKAYADGKVEIVQAGRQRSRVGTGEHAEYYTADGKVVLTGGEPMLKDSVRGDTRGAKLTYFTDDDRLVVDGEPQKPARTELKKKRR